MGFVLAFGLKFVRKYFERSVTTGSHFLAKSHKGKQTKGICFKRIAFAMEFDGGSEGGFEGFFGISLAKVSQFFGFNSTFRMAI